MVTAALPRMAAGISSSARAPATPSALPRARSRREIPVARSCLSVPCSRSPARAPKASRMMSSGTRYWSTCAAVSAPSRWPAVASCAGRMRKSFWAVGFQPDRGPGVGIHAAVEERERKPGLEGVDAVMGRRVGVLLPLRLPVFAGRLLRRRVRGFGPPGLDPAASQRDEEQHAHDGRAPAEAAVPEQVGELFSDDVPDHGFAPIRGCGRGRCARGRRGRSRRCSVR